MEEAVGGLELYYRGEKTSLEEHAGTHAEVCLEDKGVVFDFLQGMVLLVGIGKGGGGYSRTHICLI